VTAKQFLFIHSSPVDYFPLIKKTQSTYIAVQQKAKKSLNPRANASDPSAALRDILLKLTFNTNLEI
jgi:hypothetical protein